MVKCCGPKLSLFLMVIGVWGIIMLGFLGLFFRIKCPALAMDISEPANITSMENDEIKSHVDKAYLDSSQNCFVAAGIYAVVVVGAAINYKCINLRGNLD